MNLHSSNDSYSLPGIIVVLFTIALNPLLAQQTIFKSYTLRDGLISNQVRGLHQDSLGFIWVETWDGLSRFDGHVFRNYSTANGLSHNVINDLISISSNILMVAENDGTIDIIRNGVVDATSKMSSGVVNTFYRSRNFGLYATTDFSGICKFQGEQLLPLGSHSEKRSISLMHQFKDYFAVIGILGSPSGILDSNQNFVTEWKLPDEEFYTLFADKENRIWVGTSNGLMYADINNAEGPFELRSSKVIFPNLQLENVVVHAITETRNGDLWIGTKAGLFRCRADGSVRRYRHADGLVNEEITALLEDKSHVLWIGTEQGISKIDLQTTIEVHPIHQEGYGSNIVNAVGMDKNGQILFVHDLESVYRMDNGTYTKQMSSMNSQLDIYDIVNIGGQDLLNSSLGLIGLDGSVGEWKFPFKLPTSSYTIVADSIVYYASRQIFATCTKEDCIVDTTHFEVMAMALHKDGRIFIGDWGQGLFCGIPQADGRTFVWEDWSEELPEKSIRSLCLTGNGNLWVGTRYSGLVQMNSSTEHHELLNTYSEKNGLMSSRIQIIREDRSGNIWVGTNSGLEKLVPNELGYSVFPFSRIYEFYTSVNDICVDNDGSLWCGTNAGIAHIVDGNFKRDAKVTVHLTAAKIGGQEVYYPNQNQTISFPYKKNSASFEFAAPEYFNSQEISYQYHLQGSTDTTWSGPSNAHHVDYANLRPGKYRFEVFARTWDHIRSNIETQEFSIRRPYWEQLWFMLLLFLLLSFTFYLFYRFRMAQLRRVQDVRDRIAIDLHDHIGSTLTHVNILAQIGTSAKREKTSHLFERIGEEVQFSSEALDDIIWSTQSRNDVLEDLVARMQRYGAELFDPQITSFHIDTGGLDSHQVLDMELRSDIYLIYKELLRNIIKHADAKNVDVRVYKKNHRLYLIVKDNGIGFDKNKPTTRNGISNIRRRVQKWLGELHIETSENFGTEVTVMLWKRQRGKD